MKHTTLIATILFTTTSLFAQRGNSKDNVDLIFGVTPTLASIPRVDNGLKNLMLGGKIGAQFYHRKEETIFPSWSVGLYSTFLSPLAEPENVSWHNIDVESAKMNIRDAGIFCELVAAKFCEGALFDETTPQFFVSVPIYWGLLSELRMYDYNAATDEKSLIEKANFMKIEPGLNLNLTLSKFAILSGGVSYQWTYLWNKPLENVQEWPDLGIFKINMNLVVRISLFQ